MAARPDLVIEATEPVGLRARQPFIEVRSAVLDACAAEFDPAGDGSWRDQVHMTESDRLRLREGFDYSVACMAFARSLGERPDQVAQRLALRLASDADCDLLTGAESDGPYLNLRVDRRRFTSEVIEAAAAGTLVECDHEPAARRQFCLVAADEPTPGELLGTLASMASRCSGLPADPLEADPAEADALVESLIAAGVAERDRSGLTDSVFMGESGDRFLLRSLVGEPTPPASIASRIAMSAGRPVLLTVGAGNLELVSRIDTVAEAAGMTDPEVRVIEVRRRWLRLDSELRRGFAHAGPRSASASGRAPGELQLTSPPRSDRDEVFAVFRMLARVFEVNHRVLATTEADHMLRFAEELHRRIAVAQDVAPEDGRIAAATARAAFEGLVDPGVAGE